MKIFLFALAIAFLIVPLSAGALELNLDYPQFGPFDLNENQSLVEIIGFFYYFIVMIAGLAAFVMLVWGGIQWLVSGAIPAQASEARDKLRNAILGLLLILASFLIVQVINPELTVIRGDPLRDPCDDPANDCGKIVPEATPLGQLNLGVYLCREEFCRGEFIDDGNADNDDWLYIDPTTTGCDVINDLRNIPQSCAPDVSGPTPLDWHGEVAAVRFDPNQWTVTLFEDVGPGGAAICFRSTALDLDRYERTFTSGLRNETWQDKASALRVDPVGTMTSCASHGVTLPEIDEAPPNGRLQQPVVFFFNMVDFATREGRFIVGLPLETWAPNEEDTTPGTRDDEYLARPNKGVRSVLVEAGEKRCKLSGVPPSIGPPQDSCAVFVSSTTSSSINRDVPGGDPYICFTSAVRDLEVKEPTGEYIYSFRSDGSTPITDSINMVEVDHQAACINPGVVQNGI